jgi:hypothetical protein
MKNVVSHEELLQYHLRVVHRLLEIERMVERMAANQSQVITALNTLKGSIDTLKTSIAAALSSGSGAPDEQPVLDQVNAIQTEVTGLIASLPAVAQTPAAADAAQGQNQQQSN